MAQNDHVQINLAIDSTGPVRAGFGTLLILSHNAAFPERARVYTAESQVLTDGSGLSVTSPEYRALRAAFAQSPRPPEILIGRAFGSVTQRYTLGVSAVQVGRTYAATIEGDGVTTTTVSYTALADLTFASTDVNATTDAIAKTGHGMASGAGPFRLSSSGTLPGGSAADTDIWIIRVDDNSFKIAASRANALLGTAINLTDAGSGTHTLRRAQNDVIMAQLVQGANDVVGKNYTATQIVSAGETDTMRVTGDAPGRWFSIRVLDVSSLSIEMDHAAPSDVTLAEDLAAITDERPGWYGLHTLYNSKAYVLAAAAWVESNDRIYAVDVPETDAITTPLLGATDTLAALYELGYARTLPSYYPSPAAFFSAAWMGSWLTTTPGSKSAKWRTLVGIFDPKLTPTQRRNLTDRRANSYEEAATGLFITFESTVPSTAYKFIDIVRNSDWYKNALAVAMIGVLAKDQPYQPPGLVAVEGAIRGVNEEAVAATVLSVTPEPVVEVPAFSATTALDRGERNLRGVKISGAFASRIHKAIPVNVNLSF